MLYLIGVGLSKGDLSLNAINAMEKSELFFENYTSFIDDEYLDYIKETTQKEVKELNRSDMEENAKKLVIKALNSDIAILVGGDPLIATTHKILLIEAMKNSIPFKSIHSSSILSCAIGESGLDFYRFGQICTVPRYSEHYKPVSFYESIEKNIKNRLHSILLFDYKEGTSIPVREVIENLLFAEENYKKEIIKSNTEIIILHELGRKNQSIIFTVIEEAQKSNIINGLTVIIIPSKLNDIEIEMINAIKNNQKR